MNPLLLLAGAWWWEKNHGSTSSTTKKWPGPKSPPPSHVVAPPMPPMPHKEAHDKHHRSPAEQAHHAEQQVDTHKPDHHVTPADSAVHESPTHETPVHHNAERHPDAPAAPHVTVLPVQHITARAHKRAPNTEVGDVSVSSVQSILRNLGWRGDLTTKGAVQPSLTDGLYGPVTVHDWQQSARKRNLDTTIVRLGPNRVHVHPKTLKALRAASGTVSGIYIP